MASRAEIKGKVSMDGAQVEVGLSRARQSAQRFQQRIRAVGGAIGRNPVSIIVPCHRVIGSNGDLTGYGGGLHRKKALLDLEARS